MVKKQMIEEKLICEGCPGKQTPSLCDGCKGFTYSDIVVKDETNTNRAIDTLFDFLMSKKLLIAIIGFFVFMFSVFSVESHFHTFLNPVTNVQEKHFHFTIESYFLSKKTHAYIRLNNKLGLDEPIVFIINKHSNINEKEMCEYLK